MSTSIVDQPTQANEDSLNVRAYTDALAEFIKNAQAPLTIALQGEWGSGKTSMMNALRHQLVDADSAPFYGVWINTWQFSLLSDPGSAIVKILLGIIGQIADRPSSPKEKVQKVGKSLWQLVTNVANQVVAKQTGVDVKSAIADWQTGDLPQGGVSEVEALKQGLGDLIASSLSNSKKRGFLFFIDDLDRIDPPTAVEILELLKNIFDLENCIFILAIDYGVVVKGLKPKFGEMTIANQREFRSFFDKIIQLPFQMPVGAYQIDDFLLGSLQKIGYLTDEDRKNGKLCEDLTDYALESVGNNPRSLKRLINTLSLIRLLILKTQTRTDDHTFKEWKDIAFALVCFQIQYPQVRTALESFPDFVKWDDKFAQALRLDPLKPDEVEKLKGMQEFDEVWEQHLFRLCRKDAFLEAHSLHISQSLNRMRKRIEDSKNEIGEIVHNLLNLSAVTNVSSGSECVSAPRDFSKGTYLTAVREGLLGMELDAMDDEEEWYIKVFDSTSDYYITSDVKNYRTTLPCKWIHPLPVGHKGNIEYGPINFRIEHDGKSFWLRASGCIDHFDVWDAANSSNSQSKLDLSSDASERLAKEVELEIIDIWKKFEARVSVGHSPTGLWFNASVPFNGLEELKGGTFADRYCAAIEQLGRVLVRLQVACIF